MKVWNCIFNGIATLSVLACTFSAKAKLEMGGWQTHFSYRGVNQLAMTNNKVYAVSNGNLFSVDKEYNSIEQYSKLTGLTDGDIQKIAYDDNNDLLVICYSDFNIDIIKNGTTYRITDIATKEISGKTLNNIDFNGKYIYFSCGFGIVVFNTQKMEISNTYIIGTNNSYVSVIQTVVAEDSIYALTKDKLYSASINDNNLANYQHWNTCNVPVTNPLSMTYYNNLLQIFGDQWYYRDAEGWKVNPYGYITNVNHIHNYKDKMVLVSEGYYAAVFNKDCVMDTLISDYINDMVYDKKTDLLWIAKDSLRAVRKDVTINSYLPDGPYTNAVSFMNFNQGKLIAGYGINWDCEGSIQQYDGNSWTNFNYNDVESQGNNKFRMIWNATYDYNDPRRLYVGTWYGLFEFYDNKFVNQYTDEGTTFASFSGTVQIENIISTKDGYLWITNTQANDAIQCRDESGTWHSLSCSPIYGLDRSTDFIITKKNNYKVITSDYYKKSGVSCLCIIKSGSKPYIVSNYKFIQTFNISDGSSVTPTKISCVTEDNNGELWVGTSSGPIILKNLSNVFNSNYTANRIKLTRSDDATLADYLLSTEQINTIAVDGANRKWIGTHSSGVYLLSEDGQKTIHHFTTENSPLTTNSITKIVIDPNSGMVYIATPNGLFSYKSDAAEGKEDLDNVHVYPNPIRPDYDGIITISGLMEDTEVRITDLEGHVVSHGKSNGSIYTWDGILADGHRASTGVYFVFQATQDGNNANVAKFAVVKR